MQESSSENQSANGARRKVYKNFRKKAEFLAGKSPVKAIKNSTLIMAVSTFKGRYQNKLGF